MYSYGAQRQKDANGNLTINSKNTLEAVKFMKALFQETMTLEVFTWDVSSNNRAMLAGNDSHWRSTPSPSRVPAKRTTRRLHQENSPGQGRRWTGAANRSGTRDGRVRDLEVCRK